MRSSGEQPTNEELENSLKTYIKKNEIASKEYLSKKTKIVKNSHLIFADPNNMVEKVAARRPRPPLPSKSKSLAKMDALMKRESSTQNRKRCAQLGGTAMGSVNSLKPGK